MKLPVAGVLEWENPKVPIFQIDFPSFFQGISQKNHHVPRKVPKFPPTFPRNFPEYPKVHSFSPSISEVSSHCPRNLPVFPIVSEVLVPSPTSPTPRPTPASSKATGSRSVAWAKKLCRGLEMHEGLEPLLRHVGGPRVGGGWRMGGVTIVINITCIYR